ncbi:uncharacterized protein LOC128681217 [Plodia interpunctella]|uniref:uncharacterized protein LOC128681217 n=1 Tax=Plodia interpunctella TaxID=58824 RepID=UPI0023683D90|nr:uncharacterized protein LOC128681217 [Plodia interpunctella]
MARLVFLLLFFIIGTTISQSLSNESSAASSESEAPSSDRLESPVQVSPVDIENNTGPFMRSESSLNRLLALSNPPNLPVEGTLNTDSLSIDNLANQLGVTVTDQNLLGNFNNLNSDSNQQTSEPLLQQQSLDDYLHPNTLLGQQGDTSQQTVDTLQSLLNDPSQNQYTTMTKIYQAQTPMLTGPNTAQLLNSVLLNQPLQVQALNNPYQQQSTLLGNQLTDTNYIQSLGLGQQLLGQTDTNNLQSLNLGQSLLGQTDLNYAQGQNFAQTLGQTDVNNLQGLNLGQSLLGQTDINNVLGLDLSQQLLGQTNLNNFQPLNLAQTLSGQQAYLGAPISSNNMYQMLNQGSSPVQSLGVDSLLGQDLSNLQNNLEQTTDQVNPFTPPLLPPLNNNILETRLVFKNQLPNLNQPNCKAAFGALIQSALTQYMQLAKLPYCQQAGFNPLPITNLPFEIIVVPSNTAWESSNNSVLTKILWILLNRLKNQPGPNQADMVTPILLELILNPVSAPIVDVINNNKLPNIIPGQTQNVPFLLLLLKLLKNQQLTPSRAYLYKIIVDIIKKQNDLNPYDQNPEIHDLPPDFIIPSTTEIFSQDTTDLPFIVPTRYPTLPPIEYPVWPTDYPYPTAAFPTQYPTPFVIPTEYPTSHVIPTAFPTQYPTPFVIPTEYPTSHVIPTAFPTQYPTPFVIPTQYPTSHVIPTAFPTEYPTPYVLPTEYPIKYYPTEYPTPQYVTPTDQNPTSNPLPPDFSNPTTRYVILILQKYLPQQQFTVQDLTLIIQLLNTLPKTYNELLLNPQLLNQVILQLTSHNLNPQLVLAIIYKYLIQFSTQIGQNVLLPDSNRVVVLKYQIKRQNPIVYQPYYYVLYKLPYVHFLKYLQQLLLTKPYLKENRALLLKELLVLAVSNNNEVTADFNGISKEYLVQLITNQGATPLDFKVISENNVSYEQLKVLNDWNSQLGTDLVVTQAGEVVTQGGLNSEMLKGNLGSNLWAYLVQQAPVGQVTNMGTDVTTGNPLIQILRRSDSQPAVESRPNDTVTDTQDVDVGDLNV